MQQIKTRQKHFVSGRQFPTINETYDATSYSKKKKKSNTMLSLAQQL